MEDRADLRAGAQSKKLEKPIRRQRNVKVIGMQGDAADERDEGGMWLRRFVERCGKRARGRQGLFQTISGEGVKLEFARKPQPIAQQGGDGLLQRIFQLPGR